YPSNSSCSSPFDAAALSPSGPGLPSRPVKAPPASVTITACAAISSGERSGSAQISTTRSEEHTSELQLREKIVCRLLLEKKKSRSSFGIGLHLGPFKPVLLARRRSRWP